MKHQSHALPSSDMNMQNDNHNFSNIDNLTTEDKRAFIKN